jgi:acyl carrier protein
LFIGGEASDVRKMRSWLASPNCKCRVIHIYGPSECSDVTTMYVPQPDELFHAEAMPIGKPIHNAAVYVVDEGLHLLPIGLPGELCISGVGLAWGFQGRPAMTAEKFVPNPYRPGERMYRTGDRVRWLATGDIEFLGRIDNQVKIRGIRIELGEIESVLSGHPSVGEAVTVLHKGPDDDKRIVAYIVPKQGHDPNAENLRSFLRQTLPAFMIPTNFVVLDRLPLSINGKVDRNALRDDGATRSLPSEASPVYGNPVEEILAGFWSELLGVENIGVHDNFFELGGHSLLGTQLVSRVRDTFDVVFPLRRVFEGPTIAEMAQFLLQDEACGPRVSRIAPLLAKVAGFSDKEVDQLLKHRVE